MKCFECSRKGVSAEAVGLCSHCSAALCPDHVHVVDDPVTTVRPVAQEFPLPLHARLLLCDTCAQALGQRHAAKESSLEFKHA